MLPNVLQMSIVGLACLIPPTGLPVEPSADDLSDAPITLSAETSPDASQLEDAKDGAFFIRLRIENTGDDVLVLWPYVSAQLLDADGDEVPVSLRIGRWGRRRIGSDSILEDIEFVALDAGEHHDVEVRLNRCVCESQFITGWNLSRAGDYRLKLHYVYDRDEVKETFGDGCRVLDDAEQDWNRALEIDEQVEIAFTLK